MSSSGTKKEASLQANENLNPYSVKAMIFAAGLGTRLHPLTQFKPKALVELNGKTLLEIAITNLLSFGCRKIVVNVHHYAGELIMFLKNHKNFGAEIFISDESDLLLDTGGGLKKARKFLEGDEAFIVHNVDILSDVDIHEFIRIHTSGQDGRIATLMVNSRDSNRVFLVDQNDKLCGWKNFRSGEERISVPSDSLNPVSFCGIQVIEPSIFKLIELEGVFSMVDLYLNLCKNNKIVCWKNDESKWMDVGTIENLSQAEKTFF